MIWTSTGRSSRRLAEVVSALAICQAACSDPTYQPPSASATASTELPSAEGTIAPSAPDESSSGPIDPDKPMELQRFQFTSNVKNREPVDKMWRVRPGERVYAFINLRNRTGRERSIHVSFKVNGKSRTDVDLNIAESWSFRTWAYNTVKKDDKPGKLEVVITDDTHTVIVDESLPITP